MNYLFHPAAELELDESVSYHEGCQSGLGIQFAEEVLATIMRILEYPDAWSPLSKNTRRCLVNRFPFGIIYQHKSDFIYIIAVANLQRRPGYWKKRME